MNKQACLIGTLAKKIQRPTVILFVDQPDTLDWSILFKFSSELSFCRLKADPSHKKGLEGVALQIKWQLQQSMSYVLKWARHSEEPANLNCSESVAELTVELGSFAGSHSFRASFICSSACAEAGIFKTSE